MSRLRYSHLEVENPHSWGSWLWVSRRQVKWAEPGLAIFTCPACHSKHTATITQRQLDDGTVLSESAFWNTVG